MWFALTPAAVHSLGVTVLDQPLSAGLFND